MPQDVILHATPLPSCRAACPELEPTRCIGVTLCAGKAQLLSALACVKRTCRHFQEGSRLAQGARGASCAPHNGSSAICKTHAHRALQQFDWTDGRALHIVSRYVVLRIQCRSASAVRDATTWRFRICASVARHARAAPCRIPPADHVRPSVWNDAASKGNTMHGLSDSPDAFEKESIGHKVHAKPPDPPSAAA